MLLNTVPLCQMKSGAPDFLSVGEHVHSHRKTVGWWTQRNAEDNIYCAGLANVAKFVVCNLVNLFEARWFVLVALLCCMNEILFVARNVDWLPYQQMKHFNVLHSQLSFLFDTPVLLLEKVKIIFFASELFRTYNMQTCVFIWCVFIHIIVYASLFSQTIFGILFVADFPLVSLNVVSAHRTGRTWTYEYECPGRHSGAAGET